MQAVAKLAVHFGAATRIQGPFPPSVLGDKDVLGQGRDDADLIASSSNRPNITIFMLGGARGEYPLYSLIGNVTASLIWAVS